LLLAVGLAGCSRARSPAEAAPPAVAAPAPSPTAAPTENLVLPDVAGFAAGPPSPGPDYVRRTYRRGAARIEVTLARMAMSADDYAGWVKTSRASFPQAALGVPDDEANGFYQCSDGSPPSCDLLVQLRAGLHYEIRGGGTSLRADVDALARGLPGLSGPSSR
jgi:hypothetical protein